MSYKLRFEYHDDWSEGEWYEQYEIVDIFNNSTDCWIAIHQDRKCEIFASDNPEPLHAIEDWWDNLAEADIERLLHNSSNV